MSEPVFFYEREFYPLSNFSAFKLRWLGFTFYTSETAYHWTKFSTVNSKIAKSVANEIMDAASAHDSFKIAEKNVAFRREDWLVVRVGVMRNILREKAKQHEYVRRKLLESGDHDLIEDSWRDDFWGWGQHRVGQNMLGRLWMEIRGELRRS